MFFVFLSMFCSAHSTFLLQRKFLSSFVSLWNVEWERETKGEGDKNDKQYKIFYISIVVTFYMLFSANSLLVSTFIFCFRTIRIKIRSYHAFYARKSINCYKFNANRTILSRDAIQLKKNAIKRELNWNVHRKRRKKKLMFL